MEQKSAFESFELEVGNEIKDFLKEISSWGYFLSIVGFIGIGLLVLLGIVFMASMSNNAFGGNPYQGIGLPMSYFGLFYIFIALVYFFPVLYLFNFSKKMKTALQSRNNAEFVSAFSNLKSHYKFMGIFTIIIISIYLLAFLGQVMF